MDGTDQGPSSSSSPRERTGCTHGVLGQALTPAFSMGATSLLVPGTVLPPARPGSHPIVMGFSHMGANKERVALTASFSLTPHIHTQVGTTKGWR